MAFRRHSRLSRRAALLAWTATAVVATACVNHMGDDLDAVEDVAALIVEENDTHRDACLGSQALPELADESDRHRTAMSTLILDFDVALADAQHCREHGMEDLQSTVRDLVIATDLHELEMRLSTNSTSAHASCELHFERVEWIANDMHTAMDEMAGSGTCRH